MPLDQLSTYDFEDHAVRVITRDGEPWFVAADVCRVLGIVNNRDAIASLDDDEKDMVNMNTVGLTDGARGNPNAAIISESGYYTIAFRSDKPEAKRFRKWVTSVVLPAIRRTGAYVHPQAGATTAGPAGLDDMSLREAGHWLSMVREARLLKGRNAALSIWDRSPLPPIDAEAAVAAEEAHDIAAFLMECCHITGRHTDRVLAADLYAAFCQWCEAQGQPALPARAFFLRLAALSQSWRHPRTGARVVKTKANVSAYAGLILTAA